MNDSHFVGGGGFQPPKTRTVVGSHRYELKGDVSPIIANRWPVDNGPESLHPNRSHQASNKIAPRRKAEAGNKG
jgi:hypothetical protein